MTYTSLALLNGLSRCIPWRKSSPVRDRYIAKFTSCYNRFAKPLWVFIWKFIFYFNNIYYVTLLLILYFYFCIPYLFYIFCLAVAQESFKCPDDFGFYPHHISCDKYWKCDNGVAELKTCGNGLAFDASDSKYLTENCDYLHNVECGERTQLGE